MKTAFTTFIMTAILFVVAWYLKPDNNLSRLPASAEVGYDLSQMNKEEFVESVKEILVNTTRIESKKDQFQLSFANFTGFEESLSICASFPWIEITLSADGMAVHGHTPELIVTTTCDAGGERISTDLIDLKSDQVEKKYLDGYWMSDWYVRSIKLLNENDSLEVIGTDFRQTYGDVLRL